MNRPRPRILPLKLLEILLCFKCSNQVLIHRIIRELSDLIPSLCLFKIVSRVHSGCLSLDLYNINTCIYPYIHTYIHTFIHSYIHTYIHISIMEYLT